MSPSLKTPSVRSSFNLRWVVRLLHPIAADIVGTDTFIAVPSPCAYELRNSITIHLSLHKDTTFLPSVGSAYLAGGVLRMSCVHFWDFFSVFFSDIIPSFLSMLIQFRADRCHVISVQSCEQR